MNSFIYKDKTFRIGNTIGLTYRFKEGDKDRRQVFKGILIKIKGNTPQTRMITVRKVSHSGVGVERIIPLISPFLENIALLKKNTARKSKIYFIRNLSEQQVRAKLS